MQALLSCAFSVGKLVLQQWSCAFFGVWLLWGCTLFCLWKEGTKMDEYKQPYLILWGAMDKAVEAIAAQNYGQAAELLRQGQQDAEEAYITQGE